MNKKNRYISDFLFTTPSFLSGAGTVINIAGNYYQFNESETDQEADNRAITSDFNMVGQDLLDVIEKLGSNKEFALTK